MQIVDPVCLGQILGICLVGGYIHISLLVAQGVHVYILDLIIDLHDTGSHNAAHVTGMAIATGHIVEVHEHIVEITATGVDIDMVHIALSAVEEDALGVIQGLFHGLAQEAGPVSRDQIAAHGVGVVAEVHQHEGLAVLLVEAQHIDPLVHITDGSHDIGVIHTGIGADRAVFHTEAANEGNVLGLANSIAHLGGLQVLQRKHGSVCKLVVEQILVFPLQDILIFVTLQSHAGAGMGVGGGHEDGLNGDTGTLGDHLAVAVGHGLLQTAVVDAHQQHLFAVALQSQSTDLQIVQNALSVTGLEIATDTDPHRRGNIYSAETGFQFVHKYTLLYVIDALGAPCKNTGLDLFTKWSSRRP